MDVLFSSQTNMLQKITQSLRFPVVYILTHLRKSVNDKNPSSRIRYYWGKKLMPLSKRTPMITHRYRLFLLHRYELAVLVQSRDRGRCSIGLLLGLQWQTDSDKFRSL